MLRLSALVLVLVGWLASGAVAQGSLSAAQKQQAAITVTQVVKEFNNYFGNQVSPPQPTSIPEERAAARTAMLALIHPKAQFKNDMVPGDNGTTELDFPEFFQRLLTVDYPRGMDSYNLDLDDIQYGNQVDYSSENGYLLLVYARRSYTGTDRNNRFNRVTRQPCRIGVYFSMTGMVARNCKIAFLDATPAPANSTFEQSGNPSDYITLADQIQTLARSLSVGISKDVTRRITIETLSYDDKGVTNDFSQRVTLLLREKLMALNAGITIEPPSRSWEQEQMTVNGFYRQQGNNLLISAQLLDQARKPVGKPVETTIPLAAIPELQGEGDPSVLIPADVPVATQVRQTLTNTVPLANSAKLVLDLRTNKGNHSLVFHANDTMQVHVKVNKACTVRLIYRNADTSLVLLRNQDFRVRPDQVNQWIPVPAEGSETVPARFVCYGPPFGAEFLIGYASDGAFAALDTQRVDLGKNTAGEPEYLTMIRNSLAEVKKLSVARGIKIVGSPTPPGSVVEKTLQVTTLAQ